MKVERHPILLSLLVDGFEGVLQKMGELLHGLRRIVPCDLYRQTSSLPRFEGHQTEEALTIYTGGADFYPNLGLILGCNLDELRGRTDVQPVLVFQDQVKGMMKP